MSAVWQASRAAVRRRRLQTFVIGLVVLTSTVVLVVALGLLDAASAPFDDTFARQSGSQLTVTLDPAHVTDAQLAQAARLPGVAAAAGPFAEALLTAPPRNTQAPTPGVDAPPPGTITFVGRADPGGPVDRVDLWSGRWVRGPGEVVLMRPSGQRYGRYETLGSRLDLPGAPALTIVGFASSLSQTAGAWVTPEQLTELHPTAVQLLLRLRQGGTEGQLRAGLAQVTAGLPAGSVLGSLSYLNIKQDLTASARAYVPFLLAFGVLGLLVAVLITANVVSGAVVSGFRHIGVLKALGFTPNQVVSVYLVMVLVPGVIGAVLGTVLGVLAAQPLLRMSFAGFNSGLFTPVLSASVPVETLLGMPALVLLAALVPALRAHGLPAARAISAGSAPVAGRGLRIQRRLGGSRLPRAVSLGLGLPFARPGRTALTMMSLVLGVLTVTLATGLTGTVTSLMNANASRLSSTLYVGDPGLPGSVAPKLTEPQIEAKLRSLPGLTGLTAAAPVLLNVVGDNQGIHAWFTRGDAVDAGGTLVKGHWPSGPDELVAGPAFLHARSLALGDRVTLEFKGHRQTMTLVGQTMADEATVVRADWPALTALTSEPTAASYVNQYWVELAHGADVGAYDAAAKAAEPSLLPSPSAGGPNSITVTIVGTSTVLSLLLGTVAALGVFNTVVLNARERRRDLGMLKSIGMTPRQVTVMMVTSMAALGVLGGLLGVPLGIAAHRMIVPAMTAAAGIDLPARMMDVWHPWVLAVVAGAGLAIAVLGALLPARSAARLTIAEVLRSE